ncbi:MAG: lamin tail domain-containing protein, partial [Planctomycetes bacterium]|nr:lamin tail domain-containing protein [Planctomycetota bacterium]
MSLELIHPDGSPGFQIDAGARPRGNYSARGSNPKHAFRFFFREEYGDKWLDYPLFGDEGVDKFRKLDLRTVQNDSWPFQASTEMTFLLDVYARDLQRNMGQPYTRSRYHHLYINGQYWGLYQTQERSEQHYGESYLGGDDDDYDIIKATGGPLYQTEATAGTTDAWRDLWSQARNIWADPSDANYMRVQGLNPDGRRNPDYPVLVDIDNLIDFMIGIIYTGDEDRGLSLPFGNDRPNNFFAARDREGDRGFVFFAQDAEQSFESWHNVNGLFADRVGPFFDVNQNDFRYSNPQWIHQDLSAHPAYRLQFADRIHDYMFNEGLLTPSGVIAGLQTRADEIDLAIIAESARWGDGHPTRVNNPFTQQDWLDNIQDLYDDFIPRRGDIVLGQLRRAGLYPNVTAPRFNQHGGDVAVGFTLTMSVPDSPAGTPIYYTTDGVTDPRAADGSIAGARYTGPITINDSRLVQARSFVGGAWSALNSSQFTVAGADATNLRVSEIMYNPSAATEEEIERLGVSTVDNDAFEFIELLNISDAAISLVDVFFSNGVDFNFSGSNVTSLAAGQRVLVVRSEAAFAARYGDPLVGLIAGEFVNTGLSNNGETLTLLDRFGETIDRVSYENGWFGITAGKGFSLTLRDESDTVADPNVSDVWRPSSERGGSPGEADSLRTPPPGAVVINEALSHSDGPLGDRIELLNTTAGAIDLGGWFLSDDRGLLEKFRIPNGTSIAAGGYVVFDGLGAGGFSTPGAPGAIVP